MFEISIPLEMIQANPWQPRESEDPEHIQKLALSIVENGLMQKPVGRIVLQDGEVLRQEVLNLYHGANLETFLGTMRTGNWSVQLAFGHSRLAAFRWLVDVKPYSNIPNDFTSLPLMLRQLTDEEMFRFAISENLQRRDLTPIEEARAMVRYRDEFEKNSAEIGTLFGLSDSAVRNKMRLLTLPATVQDMLRSRQITEGQARALVGLYNLPEDLLEQGEALESAATPSQILEMAASGVGPAQIAAAVDTLVTLLTVPQPKQIDIFEEQNHEETEPQYSGELLQEETLDESLGKTNPDLSEDVSILHTRESEDSQPETHETGSGQDSAAVSTETVAAENVHPAASWDDAEDAEPVSAGEPTRPADSVRPGELPVQPDTRIVERLSWEQSTITINLTIWAEDMHPDGRPVMVGARINQEAPKMKLLRMNAVAAPWLVELLNELHQEWDKE